MSPDHHASERVNNAADGAAWSVPDQSAQKDALVLTASTQLTDLIATPPELSQLIQEAQDNNPDIRQRALALQIAQANYRQAIGELLPSADLDINSQRAKNSATREISNTHNASLQLNWNADLWGQLSAEAKASLADQEASRYNLIEARNLLTANVMEAWLQLIWRRQQVAIEQQRLARFEDTEAVQAQRYRAGLSALEEFDSARQNRASSAQSLKTYQLQLQNSWHNLQTLLGRISVPKDITLPETLPEVALPVADLPTDALGRRPDLQAAYQSVLAADRRTDVAYRQLLPNLNLSAALTDQGGSLRDALFTNPVWQLLGQLSAPLFEGGRLRAARDAAELTAAQSYYSYRETLLSAVVDIDQYLQTEISLRQRIPLLETSLSSNERSVDGYRRRYRDGLIQLPELLQMEQNSFDIRQTLLETRYNQLINRIELGLALGLGS